MSFLEIKDLTKKFDKSTVFENINLSVKKGEFIVLLGPSGCGKSTLLNCIAGLLKFNSGAILMEDVNMNEVHPSKRDISMVFQSYALYPNMTVRKNISFGMKVRKKTKKEIIEKTHEISTMLNMSDLLDRKTSQLSGGQQQRVAIARSLVRDPKLFLFDEPLSNLDAMLRVKMRTEIKRLHRNLKTTIIYVTHDQIEAMSLADKIAVMDKGKIMQFGSPHEIYFQPNNVFVARFIGSPPMNIIPGTLEEKNSKLVIKVKQSKSTHFLDIPKSKLSSTQGKQLKEHLGKEIFLGIRPENIYFHGPGKQKSQFHQDWVINMKQNWVLSMKVDFVEPNGADNLIILDINGEEIICRLHSDVVIPDNKVHDFYLDLEKCLLYSQQSGERIL